MGSELNKTKEFNIQLEDYSIRNALGQQQERYEKDKTQGEMDKHTREAIVKAAEINLSDYALYGAVEKLGNRIIIVVSVLDVENYELVAGAYREIINNEDMMKEAAMSVMPEIAQEISKQMKDTLARKEEQEKLLVPSFEKEDIDISVENLNLLSLMMSIDILNTGKYCVFPYNRSRDVVDDTVKWQNQEMEELGLFDGNMKLAENLKMDYTFMGTIGIMDYKYYIEGIIFNINLRNPIFHFEEIRSIGEAISVIPIIAEEITGVAEEKRMRERQAREDERLKQILAEQTQELLKQAELRKSVR